jgi:hypothetical protein
VKVFDTHVHFPWDQERDVDEIIDELVARATAADVVHLCLLGSRWGDYNERATRAIERFPNLFFGLYGINLDDEGPEQVHEAAARGFRGLKIIMPLKRYDHPDYFPIYEAAEDHDFVCLFHTGVVGGGYDFRVRDPFDPEIIAALKPREEERRERRGYSSAWMEPIALDTIAMSFPYLKIIGAHLGIGYYDIACHIARWRRNVFWDISGGELIRRHVIERNLVPAEISHYKLLYGSDNNTRFEDEIRDWQTVFDLLRLTDEQRERIFYGNAARLFGLVPVEPLPQPEPARAAAGGGS